MRVRNSVLLLLALGGAVGAQDSTARPKTAALAGMVRDPFGRPIKDATLSVDGKPLSSFTNDSGYFFLRNIPAGRNDFSVVKVGYSPVHFAIDMSPDSTLMVNIPMKPVQSLPTVDVTGAQVSAKLMRAGYYERQALGLGTFVGPDKIDKINAMVPSNFLRDVRNTRVICSNRTRECIVRMGSKIDIQAKVMTGCTPAIYVNGSRRTGELDQVVLPEEVYAIETYERRALVPMQYQPSECAIGVWTKTYADVPLRKP